MKTALLLPSELYRNRFVSVTLSIHIRRLDTAGFLSSDEYDRSTQDCGDPRVASPGILLPVMSQDMHDTMVSQ